MTLRRITMAGAFLAAALVHGGDGAGANNAGVEHLPDLRTRTPTDLVVQDGQLRLTNTVWNAGDGPLELRPVHDTITDTTDAFQRIHTHHNRKGWTLVREQLIGEFVFHDDHSHWHFDRFATYELVDSTGAVASGSKQTFCIAETDYFGGNPHASRKRSYPSSNCGKDKLQGLGPGWGDRYPYYLSGQSIPLAGVADGVYCLVSTADPDDLIIESTDTNNDARLPISLGTTGAQRTVSQLAGSC